MFEYVEKDFSFYIFFFWPKTPSTFDKYKFENAWKTCFKIEKIETLASLFLTKLMYWYVNMLNENP